MCQSLERCNTTYVFCALFKLLKKHKHNKAMPKMASVLIKSALKIIKVFDQVIECIDVPLVLI